MKKIILFLYCLCCCSAFCTNAKNAYYYYNGERTPITISEDSIRIYSINNLRTSHDGKKEVSFSFKVSSIHNEGKDAQESSSLEYIVLGDSGRTVHMSNHFYVQLFDSSDYQLLQQVADNSKVYIVGPVPYTHNWYDLIVNDSKINNSLEMSNYFYETGLFKNIDPGFIFNFQPSCVTDSHFTDQWGLPTMNACDAWDISTGDTSVTIAIIDQGVNQLHVEFTNTQFVNYYNCYLYDSTSYVAYGDHGTQIAGIIAANHNADQIAGVAPLCKIMPINHPLSMEDSVSAQFASGISWAYTHGADIINCSWGDKNGKYYACLHSALLESSISDALTLGRNGKGSVVIFAAGNQASNNLDYPAYVFSDILTVGAINQSYSRYHMSSMGSELDVMAPGTDIYSTLLTGGYGSSSGTSLAAPYAAAIAGLMLSVNPFLTQNDVVDIIESKAQKVGSYSYTPQSGRPNGNWNYEMGYGLVDAYASVVEARNRYPFISGAVSLCNTGSYHIHNMPSNATVNWSYETDIQQVGNYPIITISNTLSPTITVQRGSYYDLNSLLPQLYAGYVTLKATVTCNGVTKVFTKELFMHEDVTPTIPASQRGKIGNNETRTFYVDNMNGVNYQNVKWRIALPLSTDTITHYGYSWSITPTISTVNPGLMNIRLYNLENCDLSSFTSYNVRIDYRTPIDPFDPLLLFPNPVITNIVEVQVVDQSYADRGRDGTADERPDVDYTLELWDENYGLLKTITSSISGEKDIVTMDVSNLANGIYFLILKVDNKVVRTSKMVINR